MNLIKLCFLSLFAMLLTACGGEGSGLPSQGGGDGGETVPAIVSLQVTPATATVPVGFEQQYLALAALDDGSVMDVTSNPVVRWSTSDSSIATINNTGLATGLAPGEVIITASGTANNVPFERKVTLTVTNAVVTALQVTPATATVPVGFEQAFTAIATFSDGSALDVTRQTALAWSSSDATVATIDASKGKKGHATGIAPGTVTITAAGTANGTPFSASAQLEVTNAVVTALQVTPATATVPVGLEQAYTATATLSDGSTLDVTRQTALTWSSSDATVATIDSSKGKKGHATGVAPGTVTITAAGTANGTPFSATTQLEVTNAVVTALQVTPATATVPVGLEQAFTATAVLSDGSTLDVTNNAALSWTSSDAAATVISSQTDSNGVATGVSPGTTTITAAGTTNGTPFSATAQLEVTNAVVTSLQVTPFNRYVPVGLSREYMATAILSDGSTLDVTNNAALSWTSSDPSIVTISSQTGANGVAMGVSPGTVTITAAGTANGAPFSASTQLEVTNAVVTSLQVTPFNRYVPVGLSRQYTAIATLSDGSTLDVTNNAALSWTSSAPSIVTISSQTGADGVATGVSPGTVTITAAGTANGTSFSATTQLEVTNAVVTSLQVTPFNRSVPVGLSRQYTATATLSDGSTMDVTNDRALTWTSSDAVATVISSQTDSNGVATGVSPGTTTITAAGTVNGTSFSATTQLEVTNAVVTSLQVTPFNRSVPVGLSRQYTATATLSDGSTMDVTNDRALTWTSSDAVATIISSQTDGNGVTTGISPGAATITASGTANGTQFSASTPLEVTNAIVMGLEITPAAPTVPVWLTKSLTATATLSDNSSVDVTDDPSLIWVSSDSTIASVNQKGVVTGVVENQSAVIKASATFNGLTVTAEESLNVTPIPPLCDNQLDDTAPHNFESCLKVADVNGTWYSHTPSEAFLQALNYIKSDSSNNTGESYSQVESSTGYVSMRQDGLNITDQAINGQYDRYCRILSKVHFNGRTNWKRTSVQDLTDLFAAKGDMTANFSWRNSTSYWTSNVYTSGSNLAAPRISLRDGNKFNAVISLSAHTSCISSPL